MTIHTKTSADGRTIAVRTEISKQTLCAIKTKLLRCTSAVYVYADSNQTRQIAIRRVLRLNAKKKLSGKPRGKRWIKTKQAECAIYGHVKISLGCTCLYCGHRGG